MVVTVRHYMHDDLSRIREILAQMPSPTDHTYDADQIVDESLRAQPDGLFVAMLDSEVAGLAIMLFENWYGVAYLDYLIVDPKYHRQGVGSALVERGFAWAKERGARVSYTDTAEDNEVAVKFCRKHGLAISGRIPNFFRPRVDKVILARDLLGTDPGRKETRI